MSHQKEEQPEEYSGLVFKTHASYITEYRKNIDFIYRFYDMFDRQDQRFIREVKKCNIENKVLTDEQDEHLYFLYSIYKQMDSDDN